MEIVIFYTLACTSGA